MVQGTRGVRHTSPRKAHSWVDGVEHKHCPRCDHWLPLESFSKRSRSWDGLYEVCRSCRSAAIKIPDAHIGRPRNDHVVVDGIVCKKCSSCKQMLALAYFGVASSAWDGLANRCKGCASQRTHDSRIKHLDTRRQYDREYSIKNRDKKTAARLAWRAANLERDRANQRAWIDANRDHIRAQDRAKYDPEKQKIQNARWYENNKDRAIESANQWRLNNPEAARLNGARHTVKRRARRLLLPSDDWTIEDLIERDSLVCWICDCVVGHITPKGRRDWDIDHLVPLSRDYPDHPGDLFVNVAIACQKCNIKKAARILPEAIARYKANLRRTNASPLHGSFVVT
jgi:hypothetical protein